MSLKDAFAKAGISINIYPGDVIAVKDKEIRFPMNLVRKPHDRRFCLVLSNTLLCAKYDVVAVAPLTTRLIPKAESDLELPRTDTNGLEATSLVRLDQIQSVHKNWIIEKLGSLSAPEWQLVMKQVFWNFRR